MSKTARTIAILYNFVALAAYAANDTWLAQATTELKNLPAPEHSLPLKPTSQTERPLPNGVVRAELELKWRALYGTDLQKRAALRVVNPGVAASQLPEFIARVESADGTTAIPNIANLQEPRAIPALRRALGRVKDPMRRYFILEALYNCGDWNHSSDLLDLFNKTNQDSSALKLLGAYHPEVGRPVAVEIAGATSRNYVAKEKSLSGPLVELAFEILEQDKYPNYKPALVSYFRSWPAPIVAGKLGDYKVSDALPIIKTAALDADSSAYFNTFTCRKFYHYALARFGVPDSLKWIVDNAATWSNNAPVGKDLSAHVKWQEEHGGAEEFYNLVLKLGARDGLNAFVKLLVNETRSGAHTVSAKELILTDESSAVDALADYFSQVGELEKKWDLTEPKRLLALYASNPKAAALLEQYVPEPDKRADLLSLAQEFGVDGLIPQPLFSSVHPPLSNL